MQNIYVNDGLSLEQLRNAAGISQATMAEHLGVSQSQVSRYEQEPDEVPLKVVRKWVEFCGYTASTKGMDIGTPLADVEQRVSLMTSYAETKPEVPNQVAPQNVPVDTESFIGGIKIIARKPRIGVFGRFDAGKSRLGNVLLGGNRLPTSYQPTTSAICLIRHTSEKPTWQAEDVWIMKKGFNLDRANDEQHCLEYKLFAGGYESLKQYGTHEGSGVEHKAHAAVVYVDAPLLNGCDLIDLPGYGHSEGDEERAEMANKLVDVMIYLAPAQGFLDKNDLGYLLRLIRLLPAYETPENHIAPLRNLMIVATRADQVGNELHSIFDRSSLRACLHLDNALSERADQTGVAITDEDFRRRFFSFSADTPSVRSHFESDLKDLLVNVLPDFTLNSLNTHVRQAKAAATEKCDKWIESLILAINEQDKAKEDIKELQQREPERLAKKAVHEQHILALIETLKTESVQLVSTVFQEKTRVDDIEAMIKRRYDDKNEAQQLAGTYLVDSIQKEISDGVQIKAKRFSAELSMFLDEYKVNIDKSAFLSSGWDFNANAAFMGALTGLGTLGALATWASIAAAGSNLGGYVLIAQIVGWLSSIGISLGGAGTVISTISMIGGPVVLAIGIAIIAFIAAFSFFGDSWQTKLAKKIRDVMIEQSIESKLGFNIIKYWDATRTGFVYAVNETEKGYQSKLDSLHVLANETSHEDMEIALTYAKELRDFFGGMPWRAVAS